MDASDHVMKARCRLMTREPWYGHIAMSMSWIPSQMDGHQCKTMGVRIVNGGEIQCLYYPQFVLGLSLEELYAVVQHEIEHIVRLHCVRVDGRDPLGWNIAADMTVNGTKSHPRIGYNDVRNGLIVPMKDSIVWIPPDWPNDCAAEEYYDRLMEKAKQLQQQLQNGGGGDKDGEGGEGDDKEGKDGKGGKGGKDSGDGNGFGQTQSPYGKILDNHDLWKESDVGADEMRQVVRDMVQQATEKTQGSVPGHLKEAIARLNKPIVKWRQLLQHYMGKHVGNQRKTYSRRNRRRDEFGVPGISHHAAATVNVIIDTSGSVSAAELEQFFAEIESISAKAKTFILQWDATFQGFSSYRRGAWKNFKVNGRGGTDMAAPMKWLVDNRKVADVQIMLTDGCCNYLPKAEVRFPAITVITHPESVTSHSPEYGHVVRMK